MEAVAGGRAEECRREAGHGGGCQREGAAAYLGSLGDSNDNDVSDRPVKRRRSKGRRQGTRNHPNTSVGPVIGQIVLSFVILGRRT